MFHAKCPHDWNRRFPILSLSLGSDASLSGASGPKRNGARPPRKPPGTTANTYAKPFRLVGDSPCPSLGCACAGGLRLWHKVLRLTYCYRFCSRGWGNRPCLDVGNAGRAPPHHPPPSSQTLRRVERQCICTSHKCRPQSGSQNTRRDNGDVFEETAPGATRGGLV